MASPKVCEIRSSAFSAYNIPTSNEQAKSLLEAEQLQVTWFGKY